MTTVTNLKKFLQENSSEWTQTRVAASINVSVSALSTWLKGNYRGDNDKLERAVSRFLESRINTSAEIVQFKRDFDFVRTSVFEKIEKAFNLAEYRGEIRPIDGASGVGKTTGLLKLKKEKESTMILVQCYRGIRKNRFLKKLCKAAGIEMTGTFDDMFEELVERLQGTNRVIAIDEAEHLNVESIDAVRRINDFTGCGVVLVGLPIFYSQLSRRQVDYGYVYNRTAMRTQLGKNDDEDLLKMAATFGITSVPETVLFNACKGIGRDLKIILLESMRIAKNSGVELSDTAAFCAIIENVKGKLGRKVA